jgi:hypothetical protein
MSAGSAMCVPSNNYFSYITPRLNLTNHNTLGGVLNTFISLFVKEKKDLV